MVCPAMIDLDHELHIHIVPHEQRHDWLPVQVFHPQLLDQIMSN